MIFESHAHYDDEAFEEDREELLSKMQESGIESIINVASGLPSVKTSIELAQKYPFIYAAVGVHPDEVGILDEENFAWLETQCAKEKVVAVGEIGLDYYWDTSPRELQKRWFIRQLQMAIKTNLPVIIHSREAAQDTFEIMTKYHAHTTGGVIHCYSYSKEMALEYVKLGYYIGVGGVITFKNARKLKETVEAVPLSSILLETDSPYLAPVPNRGKRNSSLNLPYIAEEIAGIKGIDREEVIEVTCRNAKRLFLEGRS